MVTQQVDRGDPVLGFMHAWFEGIARRVDTLHLLVLMPGDYDLPDNVVVHTMGKERGAGRVGKTMKFNSLMARYVLTRKVDVVFTHMCPVYAVLAAPWCKAARVPLMMWHAHASMSRSLKMAHPLVDKVVTSSYEGYPLKGGKIRTTGQGIDTNEFRDRGRTAADKVQIMSASRITRIKDFETLFRALGILVNERGMDNFEVFILGACYNEDDERYREQLDKFLEQNDLVRFVRFLGPVPHHTMPEWYVKCDLFVTASHTGSLDKTILESMACERIPITCNTAYPPVFGDLTDTLFFEKGDDRALADRMHGILSMTDEQRRALGARLRDMVIREHSLDALMDKLVAEMKDMIL